MLPSSLTPFCVQFCRTASAQVSRTEMAVSRRSSMALADALTVSIPAESTRSMMAALLRM